jgi:tetratricopeptide (TPR) repeat protein
LLKDALQRRRRLLGEDHPATMLAMSSYAIVLRDLGRLAEAEVLFAQNLERRRRVLGSEHPATLASIHSYGLALEIQGRLAEAEPLYREALERRRRVLGSEHPATLSSMTYYAFALRERGLLAEAESLYKESSDRLGRVLGNSHLDTVRSINGLAHTWYLMGRPVEAEPLSREAIQSAIASPSVGPRHAATRRFARTYSLILVSLNRSGEARAVASAFLLQDPTTQPAATNPAGSQVVSPESDAQIRAFVAQIVAALRDGTAAQPSTRQIEPAEEESPGAKPDDPEMGVRPMLENRHN